MTEPRLLPCSHTRYTRRARALLNPIVDALYEKLGVADIIPDPQSLLLELAPWLDGFADISSIPGDTGALQVGLGLRVGVWMGVG